MLSRKEAIVIHITTRYPEPYVSRVKRLAKQREVKEAEIWRLIVMRGLELEEQTNTHLLAETLCIVRRFAADKDIELVKLGKQDARELLHRLGVMG